MEPDDTEILSPPPEPAATYAAPQAQTHQVRWRRSSTDRMVGGVCGGLGRRLGIDPAILRVAIVVAVFAGGLGLLGYVALWLLLPIDTDPNPSTLTRSLWRLVLGVLLALGAAAGAIGWIASLGGLTAVIVGGFLVGVGIWLYRRPSAPLESATDTIGFAYGGVGANAAPAPVDVTAVAPVAYYQTSPPVVREPRSYLGGYVLLAMLAVGGLMAAGAAAGVFDLNPVVFFAVLTAVGGIGLLTSAFIGRARWLILPTSVLALIAALVGPAVAFVDDLEVIDSGTSIAEGIGEGSPVWQPTANATYALGAGLPTLDLTQWATAGGPAPGPDSSVSADLRAGELTVLVPASWEVNVNAVVSAGEITVNDAPVEQTGAGAELSTVVAPAGTPTGQLDLQLTVGLGAISIQQVSADPNAPAPANPNPNTTQEDVS